MRKKQKRLLSMLAVGICLMAVICCLGCAPKEEKVKQPEETQIVQDEPEMDEDVTVAEATTEDDQKETVGTDEPEQNEEGESGTLSAEFEAQCQMLSQINFGNDSSQWYTEEMQDDVSRYAEETKGEYEGSMFPAGLVDLLEKMIYQSLDSDMHKVAWEEIQNGIYFKTTDELGASEFKIDFDEIDLVCEQLGLNEMGLGAECESMFHFHMTPEQDNYLFVRDSGGTLGVKYVSLAELVNGELVWMGGFSTKNNGYGRVIRYEDTFYYVFLERNYNLKIYDSVRLYRLGENVELSNLIIEYVPYDYCLNTVYDAVHSPRIEEYMENVKKDIMWDIYMEMGEDRDMHVYLGDAEIDEDFRLPDDDSEYHPIYYKVDFTNTGIPIYMTKSNHVPSNYYTVWALTRDFYVQNPVNGEIVCLGSIVENPVNSVDSRERLRLVQMWFKEIDGKVYTFFLYHASDYNYVLNTVLFEGAQMNRLRTDILTPKRHFILTEGVEDTSGLG